ncbi:hypothetical protein CXG81DRAFT_20675 [Caulochytrium protostelioides]|uniref:Uncharacterized protein n=1 Tax=Caulochytrium protostelioides TaxID=1555241 RepID=A0A4P9X0Y1_9FUNG|nr:hypothetical protein CAUPRSCDRAFT_10670 [Caulochytrium protostelioides]RKO99224.1 hypothetical protein CXG81DRAFT_20675 [Caulochytrium protostelioides]|eukprot:RKO99224.1 hypothetical protein CXG81DRAFT_20675 [Caulochytrium protostelioides]
MAIKLFSWRSAKTGRVEAAKAPSKIMLVAKNIAASVTFNSNQTLIQSSAAMVDEECVLASPSPLATLSTSCRVSSDVSLPAVEEPLPQESAPVAILDAGVELAAAPSKLEAASVELADAPIEDWVITPAMALKAVAVLRRSAFAEETCSDEIVQRVNTHFKINLSADDADFPYMHAEYKAVASYCHRLSSTIDGLANRFHVQMAEEVFDVPAPVINQNVDMAPILVMSACDLVSSHIDDIDESNGSPQSPPTPVNNEMTCDTLELPHVSPVSVDVCASPASLAIETCSDPDFQAASARLPEVPQYEPRRKSRSIRSSICALFCTLSQLTKPAKHYDAGGQRFPAPVLAV